eukprot:sb/3469115/
MWGYYTHFIQGGLQLSYYSRTPIYRDARGKGFCPVNRGARYIGVKYRKFPILGKFTLPVNRGSGKSGPGKSGSDLRGTMSIPLRASSFSWVNVAGSSNRNTWTISCGGGEGGGGKLEKYLARAGLEPTTSDPKLVIMCLQLSYYSRTPIYRDARGKGFCPVNRGARYIGVKYRKFPILGKFTLPVNRGSGKSGPGKSGSDLRGTMSIPLRASSFSWVNVAGSSNRNTWTISCDLFRIR